MGKELKTEKLQLLAREVGLRWAMEVRQRPLAFQEEQVALKMQMVRVASHWPDFGRSVAAQHPLTAESHQLSAVKHPLKAQVLKRPVALQKLA